MNIFNLNPEFEDDKNKSKFENLESWFNYMNSQFEKIDEMQQKSKINALLIDNDIELID